MAHPCPECGQQISVWQWTDEVDCPNCSTKLRVHYMVALLVAVGLAPLPLAGVAELVCSGNNACSTVALGVLCVAAAIPIFNGLTWLSKAE